MRISNTLVGSPVDRVEDRRFLRGEGQYVADLKNEQMTYAVVLRSTVAHGRIVAIDSAAALALPGVLKVITGADLRADLPKIPLRQQVLDEGLPYLQPVIAMGTVRYVGEPVAVIVATDMSVAEDAAALVDVEIVAIDVVVDTATSARDEVLLFPESGTNKPMVFTAERGSVAEAFATADYTRKETFSVQRHGAMPMETRGLYADWQDGRLIVHGAACRRHDRSRCRRRIRRAGRILS
jgi:carbon-monoxide dehydrogenase large subunit